MAGLKSGAIPRVLLKNTTSRLAPEAATYLSSLSASIDGESQSLCGAEEMMTVLDQKLFQHMNGTDCKRMLLKSYPTIIRYLNTNATDNLLATLVATLERAEAAVAALMTRESELLAKMDDLDNTTPIDEIQLELNDIKAECAVAVEAETLERVPRQSRARCAVHSTHGVVGQTASLARAVVAGRSRVDARPAPSRLR
jgi:hypothetical protein